MGLCLVVVEEFIEARCIQAAIEPTIEEIGCGCLDAFAGSGVQWSKTLVQELEQQIELGSRGSSSFATGLPFFGGYRKRVVVRDEMHLLSHGLRMGFCVRCEFFEGLFWFAHDWGFYWELLKRSIGNADAKV